MNRDAGLVACLLERLTTRLPHRTGTQFEDFEQDEIVSISRTTLVKVSASSILVVLDSLLALVEDLSKPYPALTAQPTHVLLSELFLLSLIADCCASHWNFISANGIKPAAGDAATNGKAAGGAVPSPLDSNLILRLFELLKLFSRPVPEGYVLPAQTILDESAVGHVVFQRSDETSSRTHSSAGSEEALESAQLLEAHAARIEQHIKRIVEYMTASSWSAAFEYTRAIIYGVRTATPGQVSAAPNSAGAEEEPSALLVLRLVSCYWVDARKLGLVIQEFCSSFLHFKRPFQNTVAAVVPLLILRWLDRYPDEFVRLHMMHKRLDGGVDTLFDMCHGVVDPGKKRSTLLPMQTTLLFLQPDVFEVASNMREAKTSSMAKKVGFLDSLRKLLRNRNEQAAYCLVCLLRAARHFDAESDAALMSYALDVQDEVRDALFRRFAPGSDSTLFEQDVMTAAFVSLAYLSFDSCVDSLAETCLAPSAPHSFKVAVIQGCSHFARISDTSRYRPLLLAAAPFLQSQLKATSTLFSDAYIAGNDSRRRASESSSAVNMICNILNLLDASPMILFEAPPKNPSERDQFFDDNFESFVSCVVSADETTRRLAANVARSLFENETILKSFRASERLNSQVYKTKFWRLTSLVLMNMCDNIAHQELDVGLKSIHGYLEARLLMLRTFRELSELSEEVADRIAASTKLETLLLVSICSANIDVCQLVTSCIGLLLEENHILESVSEPIRQSLTLLRNGDIFQEIASREFRVTGLVAFQKRIRNLLRRMQSPSSGILGAWEIAFDRWLHLSKDVSTMPSSILPEKTVAEWRNYGGFLASLGGICTADQALVLDESAASGLRWIDRISSEKHEEPLLNRFLRLSIQLLACGNVRVREIMRDGLSAEVSPTLYQPLFKALESELDVLFTGALETPAKGQDSEIIFAEQAASLLRTLVEKLETPADLAAAASIHIGVLVLNFAKFLDSVADGPSSLRVKIKICQLCEAVTARKEHLSLRDDARVRNQLLEYIFGWIARPRSPRADTVSLLARQDEIARVQRDLDKACLKCLAELTFRLPLQPSEGQTDAGTSELKSQMFHTYFNRFLSLLNLESTDLGRGDIASGTASSRDEAASTSELAIAILSNLLSANIDVGLKHSLSIGYHENVEIRTAFIKVLYNILVQGTEFSNLSDAAINQKYDELIKLLTSDMSLAVAMAAVCPSNEVDELTMSLLSIFDSRGMIFELLEALIIQEVEETENESELLRRSCVATKMLSVYAKWKGAAYLKATLQKVLERLMLTSKGLDLELDPTRMTSNDEVQKNALQLRIVAKVFIDDICASSSSIPPSFRKICSVISDAVTPRFQDAKYTAVGAFVFLRFFCPAIVAPEVEGLVGSPPSKEMRRGLLLIAKIIQNLANNVLFGAKEQYMFPLNDFLAQNIYRVTTFLREISVAPERMNEQGSEESFDFGSCVPLHRFLYDHWDSVRQRLASKERRDLVRSPNEISRARSPVLEPVKILTTSLGPPSLAASWNRPQISINSPISYSRFQNFMLRHTFRNSESYATARAVYDGGESKDGLPIICIILRHVDPESVSQDTLIYYFMKIASRMWHRPFAMLIDATCYSTQAEILPEDFFRNVDLLAPAELTRQLARVYVYNVNSAYRKHFRRIRRESIPGESGLLGPKNVEYHFIGSLQDLQAHFHLSQLHLPKETISVVTDTRYVFQPITRLSKTRGKIEVVIKVGSQFVQITTIKKQEMFSDPRHSTTVNDIFRLGDVDEAPTSIQTEDDSSFGLRADNGKIVMYFTSPKKPDVLQAIRTAKAKYAKDTKALKSFERLIRPQDVPGTLLNLALANLASGDGILRLASYNLLGALCGAFKFAAASSLMCMKDISIPMDPSKFIIDMSTSLASQEPQLTGDFLNEFFVGWDSFSDEQKPLSLAYMAPWLPSLRTSLLASDSESDKAREKIATLFRKLVDVAMSDPSLHFTLETIVWPAIYQDEALLDILVDEIIKTSLGIGLHDEHMETLTAIVTAIGTVTLRGKIISRLRKALNRSSLRPTKSLTENSVWTEICVLLQFCLSLSFNCAIQTQLYLPEIFHIVTMTCNTGTSEVRGMVHRLLFNSIHAACTSFPLEDTRHNKLRSALENLSEPKNDIFLGPTTYMRDGASMSTTQEAGPALAAIENLATALFDICAIAAPSVDIANSWRSRWMSLVASTAFQNNPAIQPRAFTVMGCLAREEVDDDLLYQVLVALRTSVGRFGDDSNSEMLVAIVTSLSKMMAKLPSASRYGMQLFWLAISLLRLVPPNLFNCTALFLEAVLSNISTSADMRGEHLAHSLLQGRVQLEDAAIPLDEIYGIHFNSEYFHFAGCATLVRGLTDTVTKANALRVLSTFLEMTSWTSPAVDKTPKYLSTSPYMALISARSISQEELKDSLWLAGIHPSGVSTKSIRTLENLGNVKDKDLLLNTSIELVDFQYLEDAMQNKTLQWLNELAKGRPAIIMHLCDPIMSVLDDILLHCQNSSTLKSAHKLLQTLNSNSKFVNALDSHDVLNEILEDMGFEGLWRSCSFNPSQENDKRAFGLTGRLIELIIT